jgi:hypothetical protein
MNLVDNHLQAEAKVHFLQRSITSFHKAKHPLSMGSHVSHHGCNSSSARVPGSVVPGDSTSRAQSSVGAWGGGTWGGGAWGSSVWGSRVHCLSGVVGRRRAYGCYFHEFQCSQQQALGVVVHPWLDQKLVKSKITSFIHCHKVAFESLFHLK